MVGALNPQKPMHIAHPFDGVDGTLDTKISLFTPRQYAFQKGNQDTWSPIKRGSLFVGSHAHSQKMHVLVQVRCPSLYLSSQTQIKASLMS